MSEDMTFCMSECNMKMCFRHPCHIKDKMYPHSYALFYNTDECMLRIGNPEEDAKKLARAMEGKKDD